MTHSLFMSSKMIKKVIFIVSFTLAAFSGFNKESFAVENSDIKTFSKTETNITVQKGSNFIIKLPSNSSTGYKWDLSKELEEKKIKFLSSEYQNPIQKNSKRPMVGVAGSELWKFIAVKKGNSVIKLKYHRPWEKDALPEEELTFKIKVM